MGKRRLITSVHLTFENYRVIAQSRLLFNFSDWIVTDNPKLGMHFDWKCSFSLQSSSFFYKFIKQLLAGSPGPKK